MARPSEINTKTIAARIPTEHYIKLMQEAHQMQISMNDLLQYKLVQAERIIQMEEELLEIKKAQEESHDEAMRQYDRANSLERQLQKCKKEGLGEY